MARGEHEDRDRGALGAGGAGRPRARRASASSRRAPRRRGSGARTASSAGSPSVDGLDVVALDLEREHERVAHAAVVLGDEDDGSRPPAHGPNPTGRVRGPARRTETRAGFLTWFSRGSTVGLTSVARRCAGPPDTPSSGEERPEPDCTASPGAGGRPPPAAGPDRVRRRDSAPPHRRSPLLRGIAHAGTDPPRSGATRPPRPPRRRRHERGRPAGLGGYLRERRDSRRGVTHDERQPDASTTRTHVTDDDSNFAATPDATRRVVARQARPRRPPVSSVARHVEPCELTPRSPSWARPRT